MATSAEESEGDHFQAFKRRNSKDQPPNMEDLRIMLVGKSGAGKSASANTILGRPEFKVGITTQSVTKESVDNSKIKNRITVIDTPSLYGTELPESCLTQRLVECITLSYPGPHVFLLVIALGRFTMEEKQAVERIQTIFGERASRHTMILFTHGDELKEDHIQKFISKAGEDLQGLLKLCRNRYHVFSNTNHDQQQVVELFDKIKQIIKDNRDTHYTNEMYQQMESATQKKADELRRKYEKELQEKIDMELQLKEMMDTLKLKERDQSEKNEEIQNLQRQYDLVKADQGKLRRKSLRVRDKAEKEIKLANINRSHKFPKCKTQ